ncbi:MAG: hypothetical protein ACTSRA_19600 [Promethearchaeota archaeon]
MKNQIKTVRCTIKSDEKLLNNIGLGNAEQAKDIDKIKNTLIWMIDSTVNTIIVVIGMGI